MKFQAKAVLFDFDGTLARTMEDNLVAWQAILANYDIKINQEDLFLREGMQILDLVRSFFEANNKPLSDPASVAKQKDEYYLANNSFALYPGVPELITRLKANNIKVAIVSASTSHRIERSLTSAFASQFEAIVTSDMFTKGKPFPDPYLIGAKLLNVSPTDCIAIENAPLGVKSAKAACMPCIGITSTVSANHLSEADHILSSIDQLSEILSIGS